MAEYEVVCDGVSASGVWCPFPPANIAAAYVRLRIPIFQGINRTIELYAATGRRSIVPCPPGGCRTIKWITGFAAGGASNTVDTPGLGPCADAYTMTATEVGADINCSITGLWPVNFLGLGASFRYDADPELRVYVWLWGGTEAWMEDLHIKSPGAPDWDEGWLSLAEVQKNWVPNILTPFYRINGSLYVNNSLGNAALQFDYLWNYQPGQPAASQPLARVPAWKYRAGVTDLFEGLLPGHSDESILANAVNDPAPWIGSEGMRYVAFERGGDVEYIQRDSDWGAPVLIRAARTNPCSIRLDPGQDVMVACIDGATNLLINNLRWNGAGYNVDAEIDTGFNASDTGDFFILSDGQIGLVYQDVPGNIQIITSDLSGGTWA